MSTRKLVAATLAAVMIFAAFAPAGAAAATADDGDGDSLDVSDDEFALEVKQTGNDVLATVTEAGAGVENVTVTASAVDENASYADSATTDGNGTAVFDAPIGNESVAVEFEATLDDEFATETVTLEPAEFDTFGSLVSAFVEDAKGDTDGPLGLTVANFVVANNPGNAPDHAGPPSHAGPPGEDTETGNQGPPEHAGGPSDADDDDDETGDNEADDDGNGNGGGPPDHANSSD
ncbi:hypothetical protein GS429_11510 [Natronorubrum sp. JWXQ-INN-674]|uniref:Uncharacterized protein n=1 Tax=Natronorubrum halalkaliphilum TaxID=2691917 RepID=A0A6B0VLF9_9EURY|nr:hypothetical protein [Natronorubrum halalkaliphilum]MXV62681.1 hypothetical protein [Natronorubrum halalkaliphilum]